MPKNRLLRALNICYIWCIFQPHKSYDLNITPAFFPTEQPAPILARYVQLLDASVLQRSYGVGDSRSVFCPPRADCEHRHDSKAVLHSLRHCDRFVIFVFLVFADSQGNETIIHLVPAICSLVSSKCAKRALPERRSSALNTIGGFKKKASPRPMTAMTHTIMIDA